MSRFFGLMLLTALLLTGALAIAGDTSTRASAPASCPPCEPCEPCAAAACPMGCC